MQIQVNIRINTDGATADQLEHLPQEFLRWLEAQVIDWAPNGASVELMNVDNEVRGA